MQEPTTSYLGKSIKENANRSRSISAVNKDFQPLEIILDRKVVDTEEGRATSESKLTLMNPSVAKTLDIHFKTESHIRITCRTKDTISPEQIPFNIEKGLASEIEDLPVMPVFQTDQALSPINIESTFKTEVVKSPSLTEEDISKGIGLQESFELSEEIFEKSEIATSPMSDHLLDTGVGTESPVTTETASSPFQLETKSVAVSPHDSATDMSFPKEDSSTQTTLVDTVSAHTSPIDLSLSFQEALLDQQIQLSMTGFESQDEIDTPEKEILEDEEVDDKLIQGHVSEIQEKELLLKSETISDQTSLKIFEQCDEKLTRDFKSVIDKESESFSFKKDITKQKPSDNDENMKKELIMKSDYSFQSAENFPKQYKSLQILESNKKSKSFMNDIIEDEKLTTDKSFKEQIDVSKKDEIVSASFIKEEKITTEWSKTEEKVKQLSMKTESGTSKEIESSLTSEVYGRPSKLQGIHSSTEPGTIHRTREIDFSTEMEGLELNEIEMKQLTPEEILSFAEKRDFFQRLSQTSNLLPPDFSSSTKVTMIKGVKLFDENDTRKGEVVEEQVSFAERLKFFQAGAEDENSSKHSSVMDDSSAFSDEGTEEAERSITEKEFAEAKICGLEEKSSSSSDFIPEKQVLKTEIQLFLKTGLGGEAIEISKIKDYSGFRKESLKEQIFFSEEDKPEILENDSFEYSEKENEISEDWEIINDDEIKEARESLDLICTDKETEETWETSSKQKLKLKEKYGEKFTKKISGAAKDIDFVQGKYKQDIESFKPELDDSINKLKDIERTDVGTIYKTEMSYIQKDKIPFEENDEQFKNETNVERKEWKILSPQEIREVYEENGIKKTVTKIITKSVERATIQTVTDKFESDLKSMKELESSQEAFTESILTEMQLLDSLSEENEVIEKGTTIEETVEIPIEEFKSKEQDKIYSLIKPETNKILDISPIITEKKHSITEELLKMKTSLIHDSTLDSQTVQNIISSENKLEYNENEKCKTQIDLIRMEQKENTYKLIPETCSKSYSDTLNDQDIKDESIKIIENIYEKKPLLKLEEICRTKKEKELENKEGRIKDEIIVSSSVNEFSEDIIQEEMKEKLKTVLPAEEMSKSSNETEELVKISNMKEDIETCENVHIAFSDDSTLYDMIQSKITPLSPEINKICTDKKSSFLKEKNIICLENSHISHLETAELADSEQSIVKEEKPQEILLDDEIFTTNITSTIVTEGNDISTAEESTVIVRKISTIINKSKNVILEDEDYIKSKPDFSLEEHLFQISDKDISPEQSGKTEVISALITNLSNEISSKCDEIPGMNTQFTENLSEKYKEQEDISSEGKIEYITQQKVMNNIKIPTSTIKIDIENKIFKEARVKDHLKNNQIKQIQNKDNTNLQNEDKLNQKVEIIEKHTSKVEENIIVKPELASAGFFDDEIKNKVSDSISEETVLADKENIKEYGQNHIYSSAKYVESIKKDTLFEITGQTNITDDNSEKIEINKMEIIENGKINLFKDDISCLPISEKSIEFEVPNMYINKRCFESDFSDDFNKIAESQEISSKTEEGKVIDIEKDIDHKMNLDVIMNNNNKKTFKMAKILSETSDFIINETEDVSSKKLPIIIKHQSTDPAVNTKYQIMESFSNDEELDILQDKFSKSEHLQISKDEIRNINIDKDSKLFSEKIKLSGKLNNERYDIALENNLKEDNYGINGIISICSQEKKYKNSSVKENYLFSVKRKTDEDKFSSKKETSLDYGLKIIQKDTNGYDLTTDKPQFDEEYYSASETDVIKAEISKQNGHLFETSKKSNYQNQDVDNISMKEGTEHKFQTDLEFELKNQVIKKNLEYTSGKEIEAAKFYKVKTQPLDFKLIEHEIKENAIKSNKKIISQTDIIPSSSVILPSFKTQQLNITDHFTEREQMADSSTNSDEHPNSGSLENIAKNNISLDIGQPIFPSELNTKESSYESVNKWMEKEMEIVREILKDGSDIFPLENYESIIAFDGEPGEDELFKRNSPTAESFDDEAQVEKCDTDLILQMLNNVSCSEIELAEVRTEDEAPDIEEDISPAAEELCNSTLQEFVKEQTFSNESFVQIPQKETLEKHISEQFTTEIYKEDQELDRQKSKSIDFYPQVSIEVEKGSHISDGINLFETNKNHVPYLENKMEVLPEKKINIEVSKSDTAFDAKTVLSSTILLKADAIHDSTSDNLTSTTVLSVKLPDEASDNTKLQLIPSGTYEIKDRKEEIKDQFEVSVKEFEQKETAEPVEQTIEAVYISPTDSEFQKEEGKCIYSQKEDPISQFYETQIKDEIKDKNETKDQHETSIKETIQSKSIEPIEQTREAIYTESSKETEYFQSETGFESDMISNKSLLDEKQCKKVSEIIAETKTIKEQSPLDNLFAIQELKVDDLGNIIQQKAEITEFIEPLSETKETEEIQYSKSLLSKVADETELLSDERKKKSVEELIQSESETRQYTKDISLDKLKIEKSELQEQPSITEIIVSETVEDECEEQIEKERQDKKKSMTESSDQIFIDVSDIENIEPDLESKTQPVITTPVTERKYKIDGTLRKSHIPVCDVTGKYTGPEVKHVEPIILEPNDYDKETLTIDRHHSTPDFRQMAGSDLEAILEEHAKEEQFRAVSESADVEVQALVEPKGFSIDADSSFPQPSSPKLDGFVDELESSYAVEYSSNFTVHEDLYIDVGLSSPKTQSFEDLKKQTMQQKLINDKNDEYSDQEVFYSEMPLSIQTSTEISNANLSCESDSEVQVQCRTQMAFDNTAFMGIDNIDICDTINREMARSPYEVVRMNLEDFYVETEQLSLSTVKSVNEEQISNSDVSQSLENKYLTESENKEIPSREEATKLAQEIIEEIKTEVAKRPLFQSISTEISDENLVEIDSIRSSSDEIEIVDANLLKLNTTLQNDKDENLIFDKQSSPALLEVEHINKAIEKTETLITKAEKVTKSNNKIKEYIKDPLKFTPEFSLYSHEESKETEETQIFTIDDDIKATSFVDDHFVTSEAAEIDMKDFHSQIPDVKQKQKYQLKDDDTYQNITIESGKEIEPFLTHAKLNGPVAVNYIPEYDDETLAIEKLKKNDEFETEHVIIETDKNNSAPISEKAELKQKISKTILVCSKKIEKEDQKSISIKNIKETEIFTEEEYTPVRISISDDQVDQEIKKILSEESQTDDDRLIDIIERPLTPEPSDEILDEVLLPESDQSSSLTTTTKKNILISEEKSFVEKAIIESEKIFCHQNLYEELESDRSSSILVNRFFETSAIDIESSDKNFSTESVFQQECADITEEAMDIGSDKCSDDIEESDKAHFELGVHFAAEPHYDEIPKYVESGYGDLYTHQEEDEEIFDDEMQGPKNLIENHKQILSDLDVLLGPKLYSKSGEHDDSSMSSLQEFERLEAEIAIGRKLSQGSVDSLNGRPPISKSGEHDDVSMNSLTEFERLERECAEAERIESVAREEAARLSEIEEGHESQASEASQETLSGPEDMDSIDSDDYEKRLSEIDEIIRQAQTNVENFQVESIAKQNLKSIKTLEKKSLNENTENDTIDLISSSSLKEQDNDSLDGNLNNVLPLKKDSRDDQDSLEMNATELKIEIPTSTVVSHDVTDDSLNEDQDNSIEHDSLLETKGHEQDSLKEDKIGDVDSLQGDQKMLMQDSLYEEKDLDDDSLHESIELPKDDIDELQLSDLNKDIDVMEFDDSLHEECDSNDKHLEYEHRLAPSMISSTDSLEPSSSTATHATYQFETDSIMSSSLNSIQTSGEETLMISSTDSLEPYRYIAADSKLCREIQDMYLDSEGNVKSNSAQAKSYIDKEGNIHPLTEIMKKLDFMKNTCVLNMVEKDKITVESIESKAIKDLINHDLSSEYISQDTSETEMKTVIKDLPPPLISEDSLDDNFDEEGNIIKKSEHSENSKSEYHSSNMLDSTLKLKEKEKESISTNENLEKQLESEFCGSKIIQSTKPGEQVEEIRTVDEYGNIRIIRRIRHIVTVQRDELNNSDIGKNDISDPEVEETRTTDEKGNVKIIRRTKRIIKMSDSQSSDIDKHFREFVQKSSVSDDSQITSPDVSQADSLQEKYFQDPRCESPVTRELIMSGRESVASIRSDFSDADSEIKEVRTTDEKGNIIIRRIKRIVTPLPPDSNPPSGRGSPYLKEPGETVEEKQTIDEKGNVIIKRIRRIVKVHPKDISETSIIPTIDNEIVSKSSENIYVESEPDEYKTDDDDGNLKISRRISKVIKMPEISNNDDTFCNIAKCDDEMKESDIKNELDEKLMTEKVLIHVKKLSPTDESNKEQQQQKNVEERLKEFLKTTIVGNSKDETQVKEEKMTDDKGNIVICRTVENFKVSEPLIHCQKFTGPDAEKQSFEFVKSFEDIQSKENLHQFEATDDEGNAICVTQEMSAQPHIHSVSFSGENYEEEMEKYMKNYKKEEIYSSQPKSSSSHNKDSSFTSINIPHSTIKISFHDVDKSSHKTPTEMFSPPVMPSTHQEERSRTELMPDHVDNRTLVQIFDSDDAIDSEEDEVIDYLKPSSSSYKDVETPSDEKKECLESSAKQL